MKNGKQNILKLNLKLMKFFNLVLSKITFSSDIINEYLINLLPLNQ